MSKPADLGSLVLPGDLKLYNSDLYSSKQYYFWRHAGRPEGRYDKVFITKVSEHQFGDDRLMYDIGFVYDETKEPESTVFIVDQKTGNYPKSLLLGRFYEIDPFKRRSSLLMHYTMSGGKRRSTRRRRRRRLN